MLRKENIRIRDPFILTDKNTGCYYMYGTTDLVPGSIAAGCTFTVYKSYDLEVFDDGKIIFDAKECCYPYDRDFWAPEVHIYNGKYYLFGSVKAEDKCRATQIFVCDTPDGKFIPLTPIPITPSDWECLDGTLWIENGKPYIVFSHEWLQVRDGQICAMELTPDLKEPAGKPILLFRASENPLTTDRGGNYITDGPFLYSENGRTKMIWSSFSGDNYVIFAAESDSLLGTWTHTGSLFDFDGGHAMIFHTLSGERRISLHKPNAVGEERLYTQKF